MICTNRKYLYFQFASSTLMQYLSVMRRLRALNWFYFVFHCSFRKNAFSQTPISSIFHYFIYEFLKLSDFFGTILYICCSTTKEKESKMKHSFIVLLGTLPTFQISYRYRNCFSFFFFFFFLTKLYLICPSPCLNSFD